MKILEWLNTNGYKAYKYLHLHNGVSIYNRDYIINQRDKATDIIYKSLNEFYVGTTPFDFSTTLPGGLDNRWIKDNDYEKQIIFGLNEQNKPPTLIYPRPIIVKKVNDNRTPDDLMNDVLLNRPFEEIFNAMYDKSIIYIL